MGLTEAHRGGFQGRAGWWIRFDYDEELIERLKEKVPASLRSWDEDKKRWWVSLEAEDTLLKLMPGLEAYRSQGALFDA